MSNRELLYSRPKEEEFPQKDIITLKKLFLRLIYHWPYFLITLIVALACAYLYCYYTIPTYRASATLLIDQEKKGASIGNDQLLEGFTLGEGTNNLDNQMMVLSSRTLVGKVIDELDLGIEYYQRGPFNKIALYPDHPIVIVSEITDTLPKDVEFIFKYLNNNEFKLYAKSIGNIKLDTISSFGSIITFMGCRFRIERNTDDFRGENKKKIYFINHDRRKLVESFRNRIEVNPTSKLGTIVKLSIEGTNKTLDRDFLNKLTDFFLNNSLEKKNQGAVRTIQFIDDQLIGISDSLVITENKLQQFRSRNKVMNLSAQGQVIIDQAMSLENERARLVIEANYFNYLSEYLVKDNAGQAPIAPATMGITDPGLTRLVEDLTDLQGQYYSRSLGEKNPLQNQLAQRVRNTKEALKETLNGVKRSNMLAMNEITEQIHTINSQAAALPVTERELLGIERKYKLNDELYTFLLEKRAEAQIRKASNMPDNEVIDPPDTEILPISPKKSLIYSIAMIVAIFIPLIWIVIDDTLNNKVREDEDIKKITGIPITGHIPHSLLKNNSAIVDESGSHASESFRSLRSRMQFLTKGAKTPVILITSTMPKEGKTFTAINLASAFSLTGKRTIIVDFDLRKPKLYNEFDLDNNQGVSTWLIGKDNLLDVIKETKYENLYVIPGGPIPPNPSELIAMERTKELLDFLKERYDCIIIDSSPIGTVTDTYHLLSMVDTTVLIVRQNITLLDLLNNNLQELVFSDVKSISVVVNDLGPEYKRYGYSGDYVFKYS